MTWGKADTTGIGEKHGTNKYTMKDEPGTINKRHSWKKLLTENWRDVIQAKQVQLKENKWDPKQSDLKHMSGIIIK